MESECACPYCGELIGLWVDEDGGSSQAYVEDCSVCCRPMQVHVHMDEDGQIAASVSRLDD